MRVDVYSAHCRAAGRDVVVVKSGGRRQPAIAGDSSGGDVFGIGAALAFAAASSGRHHCRLRLVLFRRCPWRRLAAAGHGLKLCSFDEADELRRERDARSAPAE